MYEGKEKLIKKHLSFLINEYNMSFKYQCFNDYKGFKGPIDVYSFYNYNGCFTLHNIVQRGEWGWYVSKKISTNQFELIEKEIRQVDYLKKSYFLTSSWLKELCKILKEEASTNNTIFGIKL